MRIPLSVRCLVWAAGAVVLAVGVAAAAGAVGDPVAESLQTGNIFTPYPRAADTLPERRVLKVNVQRVYDSHQRIRVAVIARPTDLAADRRYFGKPRAYARFLGKELKAFYGGPLLIVMPTGFGVYDSGRPVAAKQEVLSRITIRKRSTATLIATAADAVEDLFLAGALASKDTVAPRVSAEVSYGRPGAALKISYHVLEDSQESSEVVTVFSGSEPLATLLSPFKRAVFKNAHSVKWKLPNPAPSDLRYCVVATDRAGNSSEKACMAIMLLG